MSRACSCSGHGFMCRMLSFAGHIQDMAELGKHLRNVCTLLATHAQGIEVTEVWSGVSGALQNGSLIWWWLCL